MLSILDYSNQLLTSFHICLLAAAFITAILKLCRLKKSPFDGVRPPTGDRSDTRLVAQKAALSVSGM